MSDPQQLSLVGVDFLYAVCGWTRLSLAGDKCSAMWVHSPSGWAIRHCGHPTANWPYYAEHDDQDDIVVASNGRGFRTLALAKRAIDDLLAGMARIQLYIGPARNLR